MHRWDMDVLVPWSVYQIQIIRPFPKILALFVCFAPPTFAARSRPSL